MAAAIPYTYIQCPCTRDTHHDGDREERQDDEDSVGSSEERAGEDDDFDPHNPRANYSLYPIDHLLYCEICAQIRCQRCLVDEIVTWFCPNCLFEVPSSTVKSEGNR
jgi:dynactin-4